jgi:hypothetical protein
MSNDPKLDDFLSTFGSGAKPVSEQSFKDFLAE